jgi:hypothetical protein
MHGKTLKLHNFPSSSTCLVDQDTMQNIDLYLKTGMLPRIVRDTYTNYIGQLNTVNSHSNGIPNDAWSYSLAGKMLSVGSTHWRRGELPSETAQCSITS